MRIASPRWKTMACVAALLTTSSCFRTSPSPESALTERVLGDNVSLFYNSDQGVYGELLAMTDESFVVMRGRVWADAGPGMLQIANPSGIVVVPRRAINRIEFGLKRFDAPGGVLSQEAVEEIVHRARFPYGLSNEAMTALLRANGQSRPDTVVVRSP